MERELYVVSFFFHINYEFLPRDGLSTDGAAKPLTPTNSAASFTDKRAKIVLEKSPRTVEYLNSTNRIQLGTTTQ